ncbi:MAG: hypothetical protein EON56_01755 [Alphaproteobacteria bacterium]|nr:MAG: hypothetical protein EON56_01755 [Alphaproteobacteria bacterium]
MKRYSLSFLPLVLLAGVSVPAQAQNLLGIIGGSGEEALITLGSGDASDSGLVNLGLGGDNQVLDLNVGGESNIANAQVGSGRGSVLDANANLLGGAADVGATVGGNSLLNANVGLLNGAVGVNANVGGNGNGNGPGAGNGNGNGAGNNGALRVFSAEDGGNTAPSCSGTSPRQVQRLIEGTEIGGDWQRASNVEISRVDLCPEMQTWLAAALTNSGLGSSLRSAISNDSLLSASLDRSTYSANRVFAVQRRGNQLTVFVY